MIVMLIKQNYTKRKLHQVVFNLLESNGQKAPFPVFSADSCRNVGNSRVISIAEKTQLFKLLTTVNIIRFFYCYISHL